MQHPAHGIVRRCFHMVVFDLKTDACWNPVRFSGDSYWTSQTDRFQPRLTYDRQAAESRPR